MLIVTFDVLAYPTTDKTMSIGARQPSPESKKPEDIRDRVRDFNAIYGKIHWFVDSDPRTVKLVMEDAIPSLLVGLPAFVRPEWRENRQREHQLWDDLVKEIEVQTLYRAEKDQK